MMFFPKITFTLFALIFFQFVSINEVFGVCCERKFLLECEPNGFASNSVAYTRCGDCTRQTTHCGIGECNVLGCNCKGGCRTGKCKKNCGDRRKRQTSDNVDNFGDKNAEMLNDDVTDFIIEAADIDGDGYLNVTEAKFYVYRKQRSIPKHRVEVLVNLLDRNSDGYLSIDEIDG